VDYARSTRGMLLCDMAAALMSATDGVPLAGTTSDGIHPITQGAVSMGRALAEVLDPIVPKIPPGTSGLMTVGAGQKNIVMNGLAWGNNASGANGFSLGGGTQATAQIAGRPGALAPAPPSRPKLPRVIGGRANT
jgi:hypothetical protein